MTAVQVLEKGTYSLVEAGQRLGISGRTAHRLRLEDNFPVPVRRIGGRYKVLVAELERFLAGEQVAS